MSATSDAIIDTNVLIVASLSDREETGGSHRTPEECARVFEWLDAWRQSSASVILDQGFKIYKEYLRNLTGQDFGVLVINAKLQEFMVRYYVIEHEDDDEAAIVPEEFAGLDRSDRKFLAVALADLDAGQESEIVNATDTDDWQKIAEPCAAAGIRVRHLLDE